MREAHASGAHLIVYPELALTTFFPRWYIEDEAELDSFFEREMPGPDTLPLFELSRELGVGFYLGYAELAGRGAGNATTPRSSRPRRPHRRQIPQRSTCPAIASTSRGAASSMEKRYFTAGDGFGVNEAFGGKVGMALCNDRRWPETYRVMGLQGVEMVLIGYNTPVHNAPAPAHDDLAVPQPALAAGRRLPAAPGSRAWPRPGWRRAWTASAAAAWWRHRASGGALRHKDDELALARCGLDFCAVYKRTTFNFDLHRQPHAYGMIVARKGQALMADGSAVAG